jgi:hypothetical protein
METRNNDYIGTTDREQVIQPRVAWALARAALNNPSQAASVASLIIQVSQAAYELGRYSGIKEACEREPLNMGWIPRIVRFAKSY